jgi:long-chain acyl-CoA synthetase
MERNLGILVLGSCAAYADDIAFKVRRGFRIERLTFRDVALLARKTAGWLDSKGLERGDRIVVWAPNMPEYAALFFGAWLAGLVVVPIDVRTKQEVVDRFVGSATPRLGFKSRYLEGAFGPPTAESLALEDLFDLVQQRDPLDSFPELGPQDLCEIAFTSGTTGVPKGVMLTHGNLLAEVEALQVAFPLKRSYRALSLLPLSHIFEQAVDLLLAFSSGVSMTYLPRVNSATVVRTLREECTTCFVLVPELLRLMLAGIERRVRQKGKQGQWEGAHRIAERLPVPLRRLLFREAHAALGGRLEFIGCGSAPLDLKVASTWERMGIRVFEGYGLTEVAGAATINNWRAARLGSVGRPLPGVEIRIGADAEIQIRGPTVTSGYLGNPELTAHSFEDGWFKTGDVGYVDEDGFLHVSGREAFRIVLPDGRKVYPEDVEQALNSHPLVREACVVGLPRVGGESVHAVLLTDHPERAADIVREMNRQLSAHQQIMSHTVWSDEDFPRTPILKIDRRVVRSAVEADQPSAAAASSAEAAAAVADPLAAIIARLVQRSPGDLNDDDELGSDLGLDSLGRVELLSVIQEELGRVVDELRVEPQTTVGELRRLVDAAAPTGEARLSARWPRSWWARAFGRLLLWMAFRLQDRWMDLEIVHPEHAASLPRPSILIFNYEGPYVPLAVLRSIPTHLRSRVAIAADSRLWEAKDSWQGLLAALAVQAFPFVKSGGAVRTSLEELGSWLDHGYAVIMSPEGNPEVNGQLLPFLGGTGLMAVEMRVPVVPFRIENYHQLFDRDPKFPYLPVRRGRVRLVVGEPLFFLKGVSYQDATDRMRQALLDAR